MSSEIDDGDVLPGVLLPVGHDADTDGRAGHGRGVAAGRFGAATEDGAGTIARPHEDEI